MNFREPRTGESVIIIKKHSGKDISGNNILEYLIDDSANYIVGKISSTVNLYEYSIYTPSREIINIPKSSDDYAVIPSIEFFRYGEAYTKIIRHNVDSLSKRISISDSMRLVK